MLSNNAGDQIAPSAEAAQAAGTKVVTWDSPIPSGAGESVFVAQVDFTETGQVMADMARSILGPDGGQFAILSASPDAANQNAWIAALRDGPRHDAEVRQHRSSSRPSTATTSPRRATSRRQALIDKYPDLKLIMAPTSVGIVAAAKALPGRGPLRRHQGLRPGRARRDGRVHPERLRPGVRALELRRPGLPDLLRLATCWPPVPSRASRVSRSRPAARADVHDHRRTRPARTSRRCAS